MSGKEKRHPPSFWYQYLVDAFLVGKVRKS